MSLRKVPGALALGLLASLVAHAALYRGQHAAGGNFHVLLLEAAAAGVVGLLYGALLLAWSGARQAVTGSVLSARIAARLPGFAPLLAAAAFWYATTECLEAHHADASLFAVAVCLTATTWLVVRLCRSFCAALAATILAIAGPAFDPHSFSWFRRRGVAPARRRVACPHRRFARPPPIGSLASA